MQLTEILSEETIYTALEAAGRDDALRALLSRLVEARKLREEQIEPVLQAVLKREAVGSTAIGRGVALPHARASGLDRSVMALGLSEEGVEFNALDGEAVHAIFLVIGPEEGGDEYVVVLEKISGLIQNQDFRSFLSRARTSREVLELILEMSV